MIFKIEVNGEIKWWNLLIDGFFKCDELFMIMWIVIEIWNDGGVDFIFFFENLVIFGIIGKNV